MVAITGAVSMGLEVLASRALTLIFGASVQAFATVLMAFLANYPVAVAPAMGHNFFFAYVVVLTMKIPWQVALVAVFLSGIVFVATSSFGLR